MYDDNRLNWYLTTNASLPSYGYRLQVSSLTPSVGTPRIIIGTEGTVCPHHLCSPFLSVVSLMATMIIGNGWKRKTYPVST
jgi:hypothetical protein